MHCREFLESYSDFRDGLIPDGRRRRLLATHLANCPACRRFDASVRTGVVALRQAVEEIDPSPGFRERLRARIAAGSEPGEPVRPAAAGLAALLMFTAAVALMVAERMRRADYPTQAEAPAAPQPRPMVLFNPGVPFVTFTDLSAPAFDHGSGRVSQEVPLEGWANLPR